jgi:hypothetical protein
LIDGCAVTVAADTGSMYARRSLSRRTKARGLMSADILADLKSWRDELIGDKPHRQGELPEIEIEYLRRAIEEIEKLRAKLAAAAKGN